MLDVLSLFFGNALDLPGHAGFLLMAISLFLTNMVWLRVLLILSFACLILYYALAPVPLYTGIAWNTLFILINLYRLWTLVAARRLVDQVSGGTLLRDSLTELDDEELARILEFGELVDLDPGAPLVAEGDPVGAVYLVVTGEAEVVAANGTRLARLGRGAFIGEVAFLAGARATATVRALTPLQVIALDAGRLKAAGEADARLAAGVDRAIGAGLARMLLASSRARTRAAR